MRNKPKVDLTSLYKSLDKKHKKGEITFKEILTYIYP